MPGCFVSSDLRGWVGGGWGPGMQEWVLETISHQTYWPMWHLSKNCLQSHCYNLFLMCIHISHTVLILQVLWFGPLTHLVLQVLGFSGLGKDSWRCPSPSGLVLIVRILHPGIMCSTWQQHFSLCTFCPALRFPHWLFGSLSAYKPQPSWKGGEKPYGFLGWLWIQHEGAVSPLSRTMDVVCWHTDFCPHCGGGEGGLCSDSPVLWPFVFLCVNDAIRWECFHWSRYKIVEE